MYPSFLMYTYTYTCNYIPVYQHRHASIHSYPFTHTRTYRQTKRIHTYRRVTDTDTHTQASMLGTIPRKKKFIFKER